MLEIGCGHGALCVDALARGAKSAHGIDLDAERIQFANEAVLGRFSEFRTRLKFSAIELAALPHEMQFDVVLSKDTFEHVQDLPGLVNGIADRLAPGGKLICGFSPLFHSPWGDHGRYRLKLPWAHTLLPSRWIHAWASKRLGRRVSCPQDLGLNGLTLAQFEQSFAPATWHCEQLRVNPIEKRFVPLLDWLRRSLHASRYIRVQYLSRYFTIGVYAAFSKRAAVREETSSR